MRKKTFKVISPQWLIGCLILLGMTIGHIQALAETSPNGKEYTLLKDDVYYASLSNGSALQVVDAEWMENLIVPTEIDGIPVTEIAPSAFKDRIDIESLTVGAGMKLIGYGAFSNCGSLTAIDISKADGVTVDYEAFVNSPISGTLVCPQDVILRGYCFADTSIEGLEIPGAFSCPDRYSSFFRDCKSLKRVELGTSGVIGESTFAGCTALEYVRMPDNCRYIRKYAFFGCSALKSIENIPSDLVKIESYAFQNCGSLEEFDLPDGLESLGRMVFQNTAVKAIHIPSRFKGNNGIYNDGEIVMGDNVVGDCIGQLDSLESLYFTDDSYISKYGIGIKAPAHGNGVDVYVGGVLWTECNLTTDRTNVRHNSYANIRSLKSVTIPNNSKAVTIEEAAFENCPQLETVSIGAGSIEFGWYIFRNCTGLRTFTLSAKNKCTALSDGMFRGCTSLQSPEIDNIVAFGNGTFHRTGLTEVDNSNIVKIGWDCFRECNDLVTVNLPELEEVPDNAFYNCAKLKSVRVPAATLLEGAFGGCSALNECDFSNVRTLKNTQFKECPLLTILSMPKLECIKTHYVNLPPNLVSADFPLLSEMERSYFSGMEHLETVNIPLVRIIPDWTFDGCKSLRNIGIQNFVEIGSCAFRNCSSLATVSFGALSRLGCNAFENCTGVESIVIPETVSDLSEGDIFRGCTSLRKLEILGDVKFDLDNIEHCFNADDSELIFHGNVTFTQGSWGTNLQRLVFKKDVGMIPNRAFMSDAMTSVTFCGKIGGFAEGAFSCPNLKEIRIADMENWLTVDCGTDGSPAGKATGKVDYIKTSADGFSGFDKPIEEVVVENGVGIRPDAFIRGTLRKVTVLPSENPSEIGKGAFYYSDLEEINIGEGVTCIGQSAFEGANLKSVVLPESVNEVRDFAFQNNLNLESITISPNIKNIPSAFLANCPSLKYLNIPEGVETIGFGLLSVYENTKFISLPSTLKSLSNHNRYGTFHNLLTDVEIYCYSRSVPAITTDDFTNVTVHVPSVALSSYQLNQKWSKANLIGDLNVEHTAATAGTTLTIGVPTVNVDADNKVERYEVLCYQIDDAGNRLDPLRFLFDANGTPVIDENELQAIRHMEIMANTPGALVISGLNENAEYQYEVRGYTGNQSLVYVASGSATTSDKTTSIEAWDFDINDGEVTFYDLNGNIMKADFESLVPGIYICKTSKGTLKIQK